MSTGEPPPVCSQQGNEQSDYFEMELTDSKASYPVGKLEKILVEL